MKRRPCSGRDGMGVGVGRSAGTEDEVGSGWGLGLELHLLIDDCDHKLLKEGGRTRRHDSSDMYTHVPGTGFVAFFQDTAI